jgi:GNAT superfamily N-acetyltransferase
MINLADIARLEEARIALGISEIADESRPFAGGTMSRAAPGSWVNCACGGGLAGEVNPELVRELIDFYAGAGLEPRVELCPLAHPSLVGHLAKEGFVVRVFENVFFRPLDPAEAIAAPSPAPDGLIIRVVDRGDGRDVERFAVASIGPFIPDGKEITDGMLETVRRVARHPRCVCLCAELDGQVVGTGALELHGEISALFALSVLKEHRRRGIQQALMVWRLREAARRGARIATIGSRPGVATERNARRMGFQVAYTKVVLVRPGPGLAAVVE